MNFDLFLLTIFGKKKRSFDKRREKFYKTLIEIITNVRWFYRSFKVMILRYEVFPLFCLTPSIYIYIYSILGPVKLELGVTPSGQEIIHD